MTNGLILELGSIGLNMLNYDTPVRLADRSIYSDAISTMNCDIPDCENRANAYLKFVFVQSGGYSALSVRDICLEHYQWLMAVGTQELRQIPNPNEEKGFKPCLELLVVLGDTYWEEMIYCKGDIAAYPATVQGSRTTHKQLLYRALRSPQECDVREDGNSTNRRQ